MGNITNLNGGSNKFHMKLARRYGALNCAWLESYSISLLAKDAKLCNYL